jgi:hypothetical protein
MKFTQDYPFKKKYMHIKRTSLYNTIGTIKSIKFMNYDNKECKPSMLLFLILNTF